MTSPGAAFAVYNIFSMMPTLPGSEDSPQVVSVTLLGSERIEGQEAKHYRLAMPPSWEANGFDAWVSAEAGEVSRVSLTITSEEGEANTVTFSRIGEPVAIRAPQ